MSQPPVHGYGKVYLVGAGPGDPGLLTVRGRECLERADVVIYDALANETLLSAAPKAETIHVGKARGRHTLDQDEINRLIVEQARQVNAVVRLKGGDPFVFGRGGEEALYLAAHGVPFEVVPGVTAGVGAPAYAGIPVTHRGLAASVSFITGHAGVAAPVPPGDPESPESSGGAELARLALDGTLVFYMGVRELPRLVDQLLALGRSAGTPCAVIEWGTYPRQRNVFAPLSEIAARCAEERIEPPAVLIAGETVGLSDRLNWFENRPLHGLRVVITRAQEQAGKLATRLREYGADVFVFPTIEIAPPEAPEQFGYIGSYNWVVLTSVNGVEMLFNRLDALGQDARDLAGVKLCVIGAATAEAVSKRFLRVDLMPERYVAEELLGALEREAGPLPGKRFLLPRADLARSFLPCELRARGAEVTELVAYRTVMPGNADSLADKLVAYAPDVITFTSSSTAKNFVRILGPNRLKTVQESAVFASIGPITSATANELGLEVAIEPPQHDIPALIDAIMEWSSERKRVQGQGRTTQP